jgi:Flp pilus assembly protein TadG
MKNSHKGQTIIETALMILLLFVLFFGIAEIARFWWLKNQINNAARVGVRVAIVDTSTLLTGAADLDIGTCAYNSGTGSCTAGAPGTIQYATCSSITNGSLCAGTVVHLTVTANEDGNFIPGGIVKVTVTSPPVGTIVRGLARISLGLIPVNSSGNITLTSESTMRHE